MSLSSLYESATSNRDLLTTRPTYAKKNTDNKQTVKNKCRNRNYEFKVKFAKLHM